MPKGEAGGYGRKVSSRDSDPFLGEPLPLHFEGTTILLIPRTEETALIIHYGFFSHKLLSMIFIETDSDIYILLFCPCTLGGSWIKIMNLILTDMIQK